MRHIRAITKRGVLRQIVEGAIAAGQKISEGLLGFQTSLNSPTFRTGRVVSSTSGSGQSAAFEQQVLGREWTPENAFALSEEFFSIYELALANNPSLADDGAEASSRAILAVMFCDDRLQIVNRRGTDFTLLNFPQTGQLTQ